jgi:subtilisin
VSIQEDLPDSTSMSSRSSSAARPELMDSAPLIRAPEVWARGITGAGQVIAVLATGVDFRHPMLRGKGEAGLCRSTTAPPGYRSVCPGGEPSSDTLSSGRPCTMPGCEGGTVVASVMAGKGPSLKGIAPDAKIISAQIFSRSRFCGADADVCPSSFLSDQLSALEQIYLLRHTHNIAAVMLAVTGIEDWLVHCERDARAELVRKLYQANIATIVVAGHTPDGESSASTAPGCISQTLSVGAATKQGDQVWAYSHFSLLLDLMAPGEEIYSAIPGGGYAPYWGTGLAAAHVAGAIALLKQARPDATPFQLLNALRNGGVPVQNRQSSQPGGTWTGLMQMRIDVARALERLEEMLPEAQPVSLQRNR